MGGITVPPALAQAKTVICILFPNVRQCTLLVPLMQSLNSSSGKEGKR